MNWVTIISNEIINLKRVIKFYRMGRKDVRTATQVAPYGLDSNPIEGMIAIYAESSTKGKKTIIGYINRDHVADVGESRLFSTDADGNLMFSVHLKNDGTLELNGSTDNLLRFINTKAVIDEIQQDIADLKTVFTNWIPVVNDGGAALKTAAATWAGTALAENIDDSKIDEIKVT